MLFDALFTNGVIHTQDAACPTAHSLGVHNGRIISLDNELPATSFREVHNLGAAAVVPGFNDAHLHLTYLGEAQLQVDLRPAAVTGMDQVLAAVGQACRDAPPGAWVIGAGYDQNYLGDTHPTAEMLDRVSQGHPVWLIHNSRHMGVANTEAFERAGFPGRRNVPVPDGGAVAKDANGNAAGLLQETARALVTAAIPGKTAEDVAAMVGAGSRVALDLGITSITEPGLGAPAHIGHSAVDVAGYQLARDTGRLGVRATVMPYLTALHPLTGNADEAAGAPFGLDLGLRSGLGDEWLRIGPVKILSDGSMIGRSAFMCCDYPADDAAGISNRGMLQFPADNLRDWLTGAHRSGWQVAVHAIGDAALDVVMDILEDAQRQHPRPDTRHRIEHLSTASDLQLKRAAALGLVGVPQGRFISELGDGVVRAVGQDRVPSIYRVKGLLDAGMEIPASTDAPVVDASPILNIHDLVNRRTASGADFGPEERITVAQAVRAYTVGSAYAVHEEQYKGTLSHGMLADFVTLSEDLYRVDARNIRDVKVTGTFVAGRPVHSTR
ncbi:amidohydrolase [Arthrobacter sp. NQ4]|uniref:amidohydrolase n=1 Tax=Arthrobacter sp. NQ4 TaxID=3027930 RepID=UPI0023B17C93|nr:amidohydrolase [Arthrobacter sp. NQ4]MDE8585971.1 amidohydrolase [Arthrobacter sp. NQ4]